MRNLTLTEIGFVGGAGEECADSDQQSSGDSSIGDQTTLLEDFINAYEGIIASTVYVAERVTRAVE